MHRRCRFLAFAGMLLCVLGTLRSQPAPAGGLPLPEDYFPALKTYLDVATRQSPRMIARTTQTVLEEADRLFKRSGELPTVGGYFSYYPWNRDDRRDQPQALTSQKTAYSMTLSQPLFHWGALRDNARIGDLQLKLAAGQTGEVYRALIQEIRGQYLQLISRKAGLARGEFALRLSENQHELAKARFEAKQISTDDMANADMAWEQAKLGRDRTVEDYVESRRLFGRLCGTEPIRDEDIPLEIPAVTAQLPVVNSLADTYVKRGPDTFALRNVRNQIKVEQLNYDIAKTRLRPKVNLVAGTSQDEQSYTANIGQRYGVQSLFAGAVVSWSIFDGFATRGAKMSALARRRQMERNLHDATTDTIAAVHSQERQIGFSVRGLALAEQNLGRISELLDRRRDEQKRGTVSQADLETTQLMYSDAQLGAFAARADYLMRVAELLSLTLQDPALANLSAHP